MLINNREPGTDASWSEHAAIRDVSAAGDTSSC